MSLHIRIVLRVDPVIVPQLMLPFAIVPAFPCGPLVFDQPAVNFCELRTLL